ncbi:MAG TPA: L-seryl-tRNA(Sec) selenium transferase [Candidatus Dormibacteraeota bacterium]
MRELRKPAALPAVGTLLNQPAYARLRESYTHRLLADALREQLAGERESGALSDEEREVAVAARLALWTAPRLRRVINGTGVVLHTNLGRAPLSPGAAQAAAQAAGGYANVELDLESGRRGERGTHLAELWHRLTGAPAALVVNNNAAATLLALTALARGREVVVSRGQLVEIGGSFRMPDVMRLSGARMVEVGTTNRTRLSDYEEAIGARTAALLRVHTSNYRITGFTESAGLDELSQLASAHSIPLIDDLGSGALEPIADEPTVEESLRLADLVLFSGDKLLGGPQSGVVLGRADLVRKLARHPLARALRVDKMTMAALEATLRERLLGRTVPAQAMLAASHEELRRRAAFWMVKLADRGVNAKLLEAESAVGGGSLPERGLRTWLLALEGPASRLAAALRGGEPPVLARIEADQCCIDPRTVLRGEDETLVDCLEAAAAAIRR